MTKPTGPGVYSATYSNVPVYEFQFGEGLKEHVMRRRQDNWINATHILKAAGFDKPARTRILEREVQKEKHEKVQGGYGKYQGTWVPLDQGRALAQRNNVYDKLHTIFEFNPGDMSPPPAPKHTTAKPKAPKKPAVPKWGQNMAPVQPRMLEEETDNMSSQLNDDESVADDTTVASASFMAEDDRYDMSQPNTGHRKRKREEQQQNASDQAHMLYADELLDYFLISQKHENMPNRQSKPEPPVNFQPDWLIDTDGHSALHWAAAMGDVDIIKELKRFGATLGAQNSRGETPLMRATMFTNSQDKQSMPLVVKELIETVGAVDYCQSTVLHHAAAITHSRQKHQCARYYLDVILNKMAEVLDPADREHIINARDIDGNTALHIAAQNRARKCVRALLGRHARADIPNNDGTTADNYIQEYKRNDHHHKQGSSSPYLYPRDDFPEDGEERYKMPEEPRRNIAHVSEAAMSIEKKITPLMLEKFQDLATSFDEELVEKETSEKEARRILSVTRVELEDLNAELAEVSFARETEVEKKDSEARLDYARDMVMSVLEQQQQIKLWSWVKTEESKFALPPNPNQTQNANGDEDIRERILLAKQLEQEQNKRQKLVTGWRDALAKADNGPLSEKGERYRRLVCRALAQEPRYIDENIDMLIGELGEGVVG